MGITKKKNKKAKYIWSSVTWTHILDIAEKMTEDNNVKIRVTEEMTYLSQYITCLYLDDAIPV